MSEQLTSVEPPAQYKFKNWPVFYRQALRYHEATRPNDQLVSDRIETFRNYMSQPAINHLGAFMRPHPRYQTTDGWEDWSSGVVLALRNVDPSALEATTVNESLVHFKAGKLSEAKLWETLDKFVSEGEITSTKQRQLFWDAQSREARKKLLKWSPYFDPRDEVWQKQESGTARSAERKLAHIMEFAKSDDALAPVISSRKTWIWAEIGIFAVAYATWAIYNRQSGFQAWNFVLFVSCMSSWFIFAVLVAFVICYDSVVIYQWRKKHRVLLN